MTYKQLKNKLGTVTLIFDEKYTNELSKINEKDNIKILIKNINSTGILFEKISFDTNIIDKDTVELLEKILDMNRSNIVQINYQDLVLCFDVKNSKWYIMEANPEKILIENYQTQLNLSTSAKGFCDKIFDNLSENFKK
jgi:hypothetical protein